ncbi:hypothetical protein Pelo_2589 [Pelomyxa schiedti]|nr:hypothetical protein Pelo_2589 [Pelomyxa schiedti]
MQVNGVSLGCSESLTVLIQPTGAPSNGTVAHDVTPPPCACSATVGRGERRFFAMKFSSEGNVLQSFRDSQYATPLRKSRELDQQPHRIFNAAIDSGNEVVLIACVTGCKQFFGYAVMPSKIVEPDLSSYQGKWLPPFTLKWCCKLTTAYKFSVNYSDFDSRINALDKWGHPVTLTQNCQEIDTASGALLCEAMDNAASQQKLFETAKRQEEESQIEHFYKTNASGSHLWDGFLERLTAVGKTIFACHVGSRAYNLQVETSDIDLMAVVAFPVKVIVGSLPEPVKLVMKNSDNIKPDYTVNEALAFSNLIIAGDSRCIEMFFHDPGSEAVVYCSEEWCKLLPHRDLFLTPKMLEKYLHEVDGIKGFKKLNTLTLSVSEADPDSKVKLYKLLYILHRHLLLAKRLVNAAAPDSLKMGPKTPFSVFFRADSEEYNFLQKVRHGSIPFQELSQMLRDEFTRLTNIHKTWTDCGTDPTPLVNEWLVNVVRIPEIQLAPTTQFVQSPEQTTARTTVTLSTPSSQEQVPHLEDISAINATLPSGSKLLYLVNTQLTQYLVCGTKYAGVYAASTKSQLSIHPSPECIKSSSATIYEAERLCQLLATANPNAVALLFARSSAILVTSMEFDLILSRREHFVSKEVVDRIHQQTMQQQGRPVHKPRFGQHQQQQQKQNQVQKYTHQMSQLNTSEPEKILPTPNSPVSSSATTSSPSSPSIPASTTTASTSTDSVTTVATRADGIAETVQSTTANDGELLQCAARVTSTTGKLPLTKDIDLAPLTEWLLWLRVTLCTAS